MGLLTMMKSLPLAYNKDMQEDKEAVFDAADTVKSCLSVFCGMLNGTSFNLENMYKSALGGYSNATDAADWLVKKGVPFREAHEITGRLVLYAIEGKKPLNDLSLEELKKISNIFDTTLYEAISVETCVSARNLTGGPAADAVLNAIEKAEAFLSGNDVSL
jgi:argininosuccinate lyase